MLYSLLRPIVTIAVHVYYKHIKLNGYTKLNAPGPVIIVSNHNNAFLDAILVGVHIRHKLYSIARGDVFSGKWVIWLLGQLGILPIYRKQEGKHLMHKNEETFARAVELLHQRQRIIMFPEGDCVIEKRLRKLRKGVARIALRAANENKSNKPVTILPIGLNYSSPATFRSTLFINVGEGMNVESYLPLYRQDPAKAILQLTEAVEVKMRELLVHVQHHTDDEWFDTASQVLTATDTNAQSLQQQVLLAQRLAQKVNHHQHLLTAYNNTRSIAQQLTRHLQAVGWNTEQYIAATQKFVGPRKLFVLLVLVVFAPVLLMGGILNFPPVWLAANVAGKRVKLRHFYASVAFAVGMFGWLFYYTILLVVLALMSGASCVWPSALVVPLSGLLALLGYDAASTLWAATSWQKLRAQKPQMANEIDQNFALLKGQLKAMLQ